MRDARAGSAREAVCNLLAKRTTAATVEQIASVLKPAHGYGAVQQAVQMAKRAGEIVREGATKPYRYRIRATAATQATTAAAPVSAPSSEAAERLSPSIGTVMPVPANRSQGTIEEALGAILTDVAQSLDEIFIALPIGWSRAEAVAALKEGVLAGWVTCSKDGWTRAGDPPDAPAEAPIKVPVSHTRERLQEFRCGLNELLRDAVRLQEAPPFIRSLANAYAEVDSALGQLHA